MDRLEWAMPYRLYMEWIEFFELEDEARKRSHLEEGAAAQMGKAKKRGRKML